MANETNIIQKSAYLRGLADGMKLSANSDDTSKLLLAMIDCIDSIAVQVNDNTDLICELDDEVDSCSDSLDAFAELVFGIDDDDDEIDINDDDDLFACDDDDDDSKCFGCSCPASAMIAVATKTARIVIATAEMMIAALPAPIAMRGFRFPHCWKAIIPFAETVICRYVHQPVSRRNPIPDFAAHRTKSLLNHFFSAGFTFNMRILLFAKGVLWNLTQLLFVDVWNRQALNEVFRCIRGWKLQLLFSAKHLYLLISGVITADFRLQCFNAVLLKKLLHPT